MRVASAYPRPPRPTSAAREFGAAHIRLTGSSVVPRSTKSGMVESPVVFEAGSVSAGSGLLELKAVPQLTRWQVGCSVHRAVDDTRLEAGICVAERDCIGHDGSRIRECMGSVCDKVPAEAQLGFSVMACAVGLQDCRPPNFPRYSDITANYCSRTAVWERWRQTWRFHSAE
jgi:hypothetical protein